MDSSELRLNRLILVRRQRNKNIRPNQSPQTGKGHRLATNGKVEVQSKDQKTSQGISGDANASSKCLKPDAQVV